MVVDDGLSWNILPPPSATNAQMSITIHATGTTTDFTTNNHRTFSGLTQSNGNCTIQYIVYPTIPCVVIPCPAGIPLSTRRKLGQIAPIITFTAFPPFTL